ncbi:permease-like cell division protein FtsX [Glaciimonas sp. CA11.2]|uniref:permease-like cell division protein FtsX n=1 Tax=unclassified Glaciimonas TaxID=2644401 RepID=UPI002AB4ABD0|nr:MULTISPECIES: permease-like cell division protein FtsX [unclassified Glaciimonas]MDY7546650.1 permease-like cell division protein FtsX [Glaciimonas sp. CA11.2]MEB0011775.1 permease-like cell division protein FtsX [Glaciimonas sp. Cout2]MEB0080669.1 permease-like cell division protein FtsX [Glaciimonas sp. Gout2]MEB0161884.1 permease-like cell division protein FtsX [Glaciimonas sp. CA11.2]
MKTWLRQHVSAIAGAISHLGKAPGSFAMNVLVVAIALALPFAGLTLLQNVRPVSEQLAVQPEISVFAAMDISREKATALGAPIRSILQQHDKNAKVRFVPREQALDDMKGKTGLADALTTLGQNPLPDAYVLQLSGFNNLTEANQIDSITTQLKALPGVDNVQVDSDWVKRLAALLHITRLMLLFLAVTLAVVVVAVVFNTVRLQVLTQREEIIVAKLVGATNAYIHRPFYYSGALLGLCAGGVALGGVALGLQPLNQAIAEFARLYASEFLLLPLDLNFTVALLAISAGLGLIGAVLSVRRHLARLS